MKKSKTRTSHAGAATAPEHRAKSREKKPHLVVTREEPTVVTPSQTTFDVTPIPEHERNNELGVEQLRAAENAHADLIERPTAMTAEELDQTSKVMEAGLRTVDNPNIKIQLVEITPEWAEEMLLKFNEGNRGIDRRRLQAYVRDMQNGDWVMTGEPVILDENGHILEGQHRLNACMISKKPFTTILITGIRRKQAWTSMGTALPRRAADTLTGLGHQNTKVLQASLKLLWMYENGTLGVKKDYPSNAEILATLERNPDLENFVKGEFVKKVPGPGSLVSVLRYLFGKADEKKATDFFERLSSGAGLPAGSPVLQLRDKLTTGHHGRHKMTQYEAGALFIKAWNAFMLERDNVRLTFANSKKRKEEFPKILGLQEDIPAAGTPERAALVEGEKKAEADAPADDEGLVQ